MPNAPQKAHPLAGLKEGVLLKSLPVPRTHAAEPDKELSLYKRGKSKYPHVLVEDQFETGPDGRRTLVKSIGMVADHILVKVVAGTPVGDVEAQAAQHGGTIRRRIPKSDVYLVAFRDFDETTVSAKAEAFLADTAVVEIAEPDFIGRTSAIPNDTNYASQYAMGLIQAPAAWDITTGSTSVVVGVVDTGMNLSHPDLAANLWTNPGEIAGNGVDDDSNGYIDDVNGWDFYDNDNNPSDDHGHGTHVSGTIGAQGNNSQGVAGVCWQVKLMPLDIMDSSGFLAFSDAIEAIDYATAKGVKLSNHSWGGSGYSSLLDAAVSRARTAGHLLICAAGNDSYDIDINPEYPASLPQDNVISVANTTDQDVKYGTSNWGLTSVDLAAPGTNIQSTKGSTYGTMTGTSMAAPHVTGTCALMLANNPSMTYLNIRNRLLVAVDANASMSGKCVTGGRLNTFKALSDNLIPVAGNVSVSTDQDVAAGITLSATDQDNGPSPLTYHISTPPANGTLSSVTDNAVTYTPNTGYSGMDSFTYTAFDGQVHSSPATVTIAVVAEGTLVDENFQSPMHTSGTSLPAFAGWTWTGGGKSRTSAASDDIPCDNHPAFNNQVIQFEYTSQIIHKDLAHNWSADDVFLLSVKSSPQSWNGTLDRYIVPSLQQQDGTVLWTVTEMLPKYNNFGRKPWTAAQQFQWTIPASAFTTGTPGQPIRLQLASSGSRGIYVDDVTLTVSTGTPPNTYAITYDGNGHTGGSVPSSQTKTEGVALPLATNSGDLVKTGFTFAGWNTQANGLGTDYAAEGSYTTDANLSLYAKWTPAPTYTVSYNGNGHTGGTVPGNQTKTQGVDLPLATNTGSLVKSGHSFVGWNTVNDGSGVHYAEGATYSADAAVTLYAKWNALAVANAGTDQVAVLNGTPWSPTDITSLVAWYDANDAATITASGGAVSAWNDKSGNNNHASQSTGSNQPEIGVQTLTLNELPLITARSGAKFMSVANSPTMLMGMAMVNIRSGSTATILNVGSTSSSTHEFFIRGGSPQLSFDGNGTTTGTYNVDGGSFSGLAEDHSITATGAHIWGGVFSSSNTLTTIINRSGLNSDATGHDVGEIFWFSAEISEADRQKVEGYLAHKWGLHANLPESHPYKHSSPVGSAAQVTLNGTASDADIGDTVTTLWTDTGTGTGTGTVTFSDASSLSSTATFTHAGTYILRLTANDGNGTVYDEVTITVQEATGNTSPVANDASVTTQKDFATGIILTGSDNDGDELTYSVVTGPANGVLSGTAPNLTYTPNFHFSGADSFTFKTNDGTDDSNLATVSITVQGVRVIDYVAPAPGTVKTYKVALLMINTLTSPRADNPVTKQLEFYTPENLGQIFFEHEHGAASFIKEASYGKVALEGRVVGWIDQPVAGLNGTDISANKDTYLSLANQYLTYSDYDVFVVHSLVEGSGQQTGWLYPQQSITTPQGTINNIGITWMANSQVFDFAPLLTSNWSSGDAVLPTTSWSHELLHTFGIAGHANSYDCGTATLDPNSASDPVKGYGNPFSIMGEYAYATHPDALMKSRIGWLTPEQVPQVTTTGTHEIYPLAVNDGQTKALVIPLSPPITHSLNASEFDALIVEYRTATGFDRYMERLSGSTFLSQYTSLTDIDTNGVIVYMRYANSDTDATALLDMNPTTTFRADRGIKWPGNAGKFADAILPAGRTFTWNNIQITPLGTTQSGAMRVSVTKSSSYVAWSQKTFTNPLNDVVTDHDPDGDGVNNFMEFALGTDPTNPRTGALSADGSANGTPKPTSADGTNFDLLFVRRDDHGTTGSIAYTVQFSGDLVTFHDSAATPQPVADSTDDPDYEVVKVPFPTDPLPDGKKATFGRIRVVLVP